MRFEITVHLNATPQAVWQLITDPQAICHCLGGLESLVVEAGGRQFQATIPLAMGQMRFLCLAHMEWLAQEPPRSARLRAHIYPGQDAGTGAGTPAAGKSGVGAAVATVANELHLQATAPQRTLLQWYSLVTLVGKMSNTPPPLVRGLIEQHSRAFFTCFKALVENPA